MVPIMSITEIKNWNTTNPLRKLILFLFETNLLFKTATGLNEERKNAG